MKTERSFPKAIITKKGENWSKANLKTVRLLMRFPKKENISELVLSAPKAKSVSALFQKTRTINSTVIFGKEGSDMPGITGKP